MAPELVATTVCAECGADLPPSAGVCPGCGIASSVAAVRKPPALASSAAGGRSLLDRPWFVLGLLFFVTAILGLPLLWISRGFPRVWKIVLSVVVTVYTALLLWGFWWLMNWSVSRIMDSLR